MEILVVNDDSRVRDFVVGIDYDDRYDVNDDRGHMTIRRRVTMEDLIFEIRQIIRVGSYYPQFPPEALPQVTYVWDLSSQENGDCYDEIMSRLERTE